MKLYPVSERFVLRVSGRGPEVVVEYLVATLSFMNSMSFAMIVAGEPSRSRECNNSTVVGMERYESEVGKLSLSLSQM